MSLPICHEQTFVLEAECERRHAGRHAGFLKTGTVELGVCAGSEELGKAEKWGFDYLEPAAAAIAAMSGAEFERFREQVLASRLRCLSFNSLIRTMQVVGPTANL